MKNPLEKSINSQEKQERRGHNVRIELDLIRHAQKTSFDGPITPEGRKMAEKFGNDKEVKVFHSSSLRARQTAEAISKDSLYVPRERKELAGEFSAEFLQEYGRVTAENNGDESKALQLYLDSDDKRPDEKTLSSREISGQLAKSLKHFVDVSERLNDNSQVNIVLVSHSGMIEHLLADLLAEDRPGFVDKIGGGLKPLEGAKFIISRDSNGQAHLTLEFRGQHKEIDPQFLENL